MQFASLLLNGTDGTRCPPAILAIPSKAFADCPPMDVLLPDRRKIMKSRYAPLAAMFVVLALAVAFAMADRPPVLGPDKDADGKPLPFGRQPHQPNDKPLGTGPFKAVMAEDPSLPDHTLYYPVNMTSAGKLPVITWGNGACLNAGN